MSIPGYRTFDPNRLHALVDEMNTRTYGLRGDALRTARVLTQLGSSGTGDLPDYIYRASEGEITFATNTTLATIDPIVWDVNRYYRDLGIDWPHRPTRRDLRMAFLASDGHSSQRLTYILTQLLNPDVRARYDAHPLGHYFDDYYGWLRLKKMAAQWAGDRTAATGENHSAADFLREELGITDEPPAPEQHTVDSTWPYAFWLWRSRKNADADVRDWQQMLVSACAQVGVSPHLDVGYVGGTDEPWLITAHQTYRSTHTIVFLHEEQLPTPAMAQDAAILLARKEHQS